jgi:hypothetical protein
MTYQPGSAFIRQISVRKTIVATKTKGRLKELKAWVAGHHPDQVRYREIPLKS